jgi:hypothetical protein
MGIPPPLATQTIGKLLGIPSHIQIPIGHSWAIRPRDPETICCLSDADRNLFTSVETAGLDALRLSSGTSIHPEKRNDAQNQVSQSHDHPYPQTKILGLLLASPHFATAKGFETDRTQHP